MNTDTPTENTTTPAPQQPVIAGGPMFWMIQSASIPGRSTILPADKYQVDIDPTAHNKDDENFYTSVRFTQIEGIPQAKPIGLRFDTLGVALSSLKLVSGAQLAQAITKSAKRLQLQAQAEAEQAEANADAAAQAAQMMADSKPTGEPPVPPAAA